MKLDLFVLLLTGLAPAAVFTLSTVYHKYHLITKSYSWSMAQNYCRLMNADLATVVTDDDLQEMNKEAKRKGHMGPAWTGLYNDIDSWRWSLNELPLKNVTYKNWDSGQPNNLAGKEACAVIYGTGLWGDDSCMYTRPFICYDAQLSSSAKFISYSTPLTWPQALSYCRKHHTDLASSLSSSDNIIILQLPNFQAHSWFGLYRDTWKWSDGTNTSNLLWASGQPDNFGGNQNCAFYVTNTFNDDFCNSAHFFYCCSNIWKKQIIKLQVRSDGSVLDPAMQSSILDQLKNKLNEKGMLENSTVTWLVQPDGNIFQKKSKKDL